MTTRALAHAREVAADEVEETITRLGYALSAYRRTTQALRVHVQQELPPLDLPIQLLLSQAGLAAWLERKLVVHSPVSLRALVADQHARIAGAFSTERG